MIAVRVIGIDPSLTSTGLAQVSQGFEMGAHWSFETVRSKPSGSSIGARSTRLLAIEDRVRQVVQRAGLVVIEAPAYSRSVGSRHERSGLWWLLVAAALAEGCRVVEVSPTARARYATGKGNAPKAAVVAAVSARYGVAPSNDNEADAIALAALGMRLAGLPIEPVAEPWMDEVAATVRGDL